MLRGESKDQTAEGPLLRVSYNLGQILRHDTRWRGRLRYNEFRSDEEIADLVAASSDADPAPLVFRTLTDTDFVAIGRWVSEVYGLHFPSNIVAEQVLLAAKDYPVHPVRSYLASLQWDGVQRMDTWMMTALGAAPSDVNRLIGRAWLVSMVARVRDPGCKVDTMPILIGAQGRRKSTALRALMPDPAWFCDSDIPLRHHQDKYQILAGVWLYEIAEFDRFSSKADASEIKAYVSSQTDRFRKSHGRRTNTVPRQSVFAGSTNAAEFLVDPTGSRRYWPVRCGECEPSAIAEIRDQLWAEAVVAYELGESWWLSSEADKVIATAADEFRVSDPWDDAVLRWLRENPAPTTGHSIEAILTGAVSKAIGEVGRPEQMRIAAIITRWGWKKQKKMNVWRWFQPTEQSSVFQPAENVGAQV